MANYISRSTWNGSLKDGSGQVGVESGVIDAAISEASRKSEATNPEEMLGGALASSYCLRLAGLFEQAQVVSKSIRTTAVVDVRASGSMSTISKIGLDIDVQAEELDQERLETFAERALAECPVANALADTEISIAVKLSKS